MDDEPKFGWCYFRRGLVGHKGKNHYLPKDDWTSRCGHWIVQHSDRPHIHFVDKSQLRSRKICKKCEAFLKLDNSNKLIIHHLIHGAGLERKNA